MANGAPLLAARLLGHHYNRPLDGGVCLADGQPLLGAAKTWRGIISCLLLTPLLAMLLCLSLVIGLGLAAFAMLGDLCSSFIKRRLAMPASSQALLLDQLPESLLPVLAAMYWLPLGWWQGGLIVIAFVAIDIYLSPLLYRLGLRLKPY